METHDFKPDFYAEFNPRDFVGYPNSLPTVEMIQQRSLEEHVKYLNEVTVQMEKLNNNAELWFIKALFKS